MGADTIEVACLPEDARGLLISQVFLKLDITSRNQLARIPPSHLNTCQIGD